MHKTKYTRKQIKAAMELLIAEEATKMEEEKHKQKIEILLSMGRQRLAEALDAIEARKVHHGNVSKCPVCPDRPVLYISTVSTMKVIRSCLKCGYTLTITRSDTPEGRAQRAMEYRLTKKLKKESEK